MFRHLTAWLLLPFAFLYGCGLCCVRSAYRWGGRKIHYNNKSYLVNIGNLSVGGTGKSPHVDFLAQQLGAAYPIAVLSRGYGRSKRGVYPVSATDTPQIAGDEPLQLKRRRLWLPVWVAERRADGVSAIQQSKPDTAMILLDDAFQHWALHSHYHILLTTYTQPFFDDYLLPAGRLREPRSGYRRADMIIITQCPNDPDRSAFLARLCPLPHQQIFFSTYRYDKLYLLTDPARQLDPHRLTADYTVIVCIAIAQSAHLRQYLEKFSFRTQWLQHKDHHLFTKADLEQLQTRRTAVLPRPVLVLTTEKDATRLLPHAHWLQENQIEVYVLPIQVEILFGQSQQLVDCIRQAYGAGWGLREG